MEQDRLMIRSLSLCSIYDHPTDVNTIEPMMRIGRTTRNFTFVRFHLLAIAIHYIFVAMHHCYMDPEL